MTKRALRPSAGKTGTDESHRSEHVDRIPTTDAIDLQIYDRIVVAFSGGKDSLACLLQLLRSGVDPAVIELWHHDVDGQEGSTLMDWPVTRSYCQAVADHFNLPLYFSWKQGGFEGEMTREEAPTAPTRYEVPGGAIQTTGGTGTPGTRLKFPQVSADLRVRWCSAYLKIDIMDKAIRGQERFKDGRTLVVTGERAEESTSRSRYATFEPHRTHGNLRHVDHWRPVHSWLEADVWGIIHAYGIDPHPAYHLGWSRLSCAACIFGSANQWATLRHLAPLMFEEIAQYEELFNTTIQRKRTVRDLADAGTVYAAAHAQDAQYWAALAFSNHYDRPIFTSHWQMPAGAFGENAGPV